MKTQLRLNSLVLHGVGSGPESGAIDLIYGFLLTEFEQDTYKYITINQIGSDLKEFVMKEAGNKIHINIRYPTHKDFDTKSITEKNLIRLDVIHTALLRVANQYGKLEIQKLEGIKEKIISNNFSFDFVCKVYNYKKSQNLLTKIIVHPEIDKFNYYCLIEENEEVKCKVRIYRGLTNLYYYQDLFSDVKWKSEDEIVITGKAKQVEISVLINECTAAFKNLTQYEKAPYFEMMRGDITKSEREIAHLNWLHSLPPAHAALLRESHN